MIYARLSDVARWSGAKHIGRDVEFNGLSIDSRRIVKGMLFVALRGERSDGHQFIDDARANGAVAALVSKPLPTSLPLLVSEQPLHVLAKLAAVWRNRFDIPLIGVLGSNGKTTVKELIAAILGQDARYRFLATEGNQNNALGVPLSLFRLSYRHNFAILELGANKPGEIAFLADMTKPNIAIITNAGLDHIAGFGGIEGAARANGEVFSAMERNGIAILNDDDECLPIWQRQAGTHSQIRFGFKPHADVFGTWQPSLDGDLLTIESPWGRIDTRLQLIGQHNALNALAAATVCLALGIDAEMVAAGLAAMRPVNGRLQSRLAIGGARIIDDTYNANPSSLSAALEAMASMTGTKILVLGDMAELGDQALEWHRWAGQAARDAGISRLFTLGELAGLAYESFGEGGEHFADMPQLIAALHLQLKPGVTVLVKGSRCMAMENIVSELEY